MKKIDSRVSPGAENNYVNGMLKLDDSDFREAYLESMEKYGDWWNGGAVPRCARCFGAIKEPKDLRKYAGRPLHPKCFKEEWEKNKEKEIDPLLRTYWERVANLMTD